MRLVVRRGLLLALAGAVIGMGAAMAVTRLMAAMLYSVRPYDPATFAGVCFLLMLVALAACSIPARRLCASTPWSLCATSDSHCQNDKYLSMASWVRCSIGLSGVEKVAFLVAAELYIVACGSAVKRLRKFLP